MTTNETPPIRFHFEGSAEPVLILTKEGFTYLGKTIEDAGEAHSLFLAAMSKVKYG